ncbi:MAG: hypothetical protein AB7F66_07300 [Bacteriovoracia bacterium]
MKNLLWLAIVVFGLNMAAISVRAEELSSPTDARSAFCEVTAAMLKNNVDIDALDRLETKGAVKAASAAQAR